MHYWFVIDGSIVSYVWAVNGNNVATGSTISLKLTDFGANTVTLTVTDNDGNESTDEVIITILENTESSDIYSFEVYSKMIGSHESNITKPRIYVKNTGTEPVSDFKVRYYFTEENGSAIGEFWHNPYSSATVVQVDDINYYTEFDYADFALLADGVTPHLDGTSFGVHLSDWSEIDKIDDFSYIESTDFIENDNIAIFDKDNKLIHGNIPDYEVSGVDDSGDDDESYPHKYNMTAVTPFEYDLAITWDAISDEDYPGTVLTISTADGYYKSYTFDVNYPSANIYIEDPENFASIFIIELYQDGVLVDRAEAYNSLY